MSGMALWLTGLPGSGKSTIASALKESHPEFVILNMDELRKIVTPEPAYSDYERELVYRCLVYLARILTEHGHNVMIDATGNKRKWRELARQLINKYAEIYLKCPLDECMTRENRRQIKHEAPEGIYRKGEEGWPVPGVNAPYEEPQNPELVIETDRVTVKEAVSLIDGLILRSKKSDSKN